MEMKKCSKCGFTQELSKYHKDKGPKDGLSAYCKECKKLYDLLYRKTDKIQDLYKSKGYRDSKRDYMKQRFYTRPECQLIINARLRAKKLGLPMDITYDDIKIPIYCPILGLKLERKEFGKSGSFQPCSPSLDKIDPKLGYVKGNIQIISMKANAMKYNATPQELELFCKNMLKVLKKHKQHYANINKDILTSP